MLLGYSLREDIIVVRGSHVVPHLHRHHRWPADWLVDRRRRPDLPVPAPPLHPHPRPRARRRCLRAATQHAQCMGAPEHRRTRARHGRPSQLRPVPARVVRLRAHHDPARRHYGLDILDPVAGAECFGLHLRRTLAVARPHRGCCGFWRHGARQRVARARHCRRCSPCSLPPYSRRSCPTRSCAARPCSGRCSRVRPQRKGNHCPDDGER